MTKRHQVIADELLATIGTRVRRKISDVETNLKDEGKQTLNLKLVFVEENGVVEVTTTGSLKGDFDCDSVKLEYARGQLQLFAEVGEPK